MPRDDGNHPVDLRLADRRGHVGAVDPHAIVVVEPHGLLLRELRERVGVAELEAALHREPRERAVHRAGVEVAEAEPLGERARHSALARSRRPVDRDDHQCSFSECRRVTDERKASEARTQGIPIAVAIGVTEDAASRHFAAVRGVDDVC